MVLRVRWARQRLLGWLVGAGRIMRHPTRQIAVDQKGRERRLPRGIRLPSGAQLVGVSPGGVVAYTHHAGPATLELRARIMGDAVVETEWSGPPGADPADRVVRRRLLHAIADDRCLAPGETPVALPQDKDVTLRVLLRGRRHGGYALVAGSDDAFRAAVPILVAWARAQRA